ncbi:MAG: dipicolinate synthase subunit B [Clostridia bacterium]|nr:dipicolinate synthase subunit B [Clostridia bacterium]
MHEQATIGFALTGSFCTFGKILPIMKVLSDIYTLLPIMSVNAFETDTKFGPAKEFIEEIQDICGNKILHTLQAVEPIGPKGMTDLIVVAPCTGNTLSKLSHGITDTPVTMACKSQLRVSRPILLGISSNDGLGAAAENVGRLLNRKNYYFVPFGQDDPQKKPFSLVANWSFLPRAIESALTGKQLQPILSSIN